MEKEEILSKIKSELGQTNLSDRTLDAFVDNMIAGHEAVDDTHISNSVSFLKTLQGQYNHDMSDQVERFKKEYSPQPTASNPPDGQAAEKKDPENVSKIQSLTEKMEAVLAKIESKEKQAQIELLKSEAQKIVKSKGAENDSVIRIAASMIQVDDSDTKETLASKMEDRYNALYSELYGKGASPSGNGTTGKIDTKAEKEKYLKHLVETGRIQEPKNN